MGCGGSKEDVATGNTTVNGAGRGGKLFRRKSTMSASHRSSHASSPSSSDDNSVSVKDIVKEPKAVVVEVASDGKAVAVVEDTEEEVVVAKKDFPGDEVSATVDEAPQPPLKEEDELPKSTMADEAPVVEEAKVEAKEAALVLIKEETKPEETKEEEMSPASTNERGESARQSTIEHMEANPVDEHKVKDDAPPVPKPSSSVNSASATVVPNQIDGELTE
ncbi:hypothetical protein D1007_00006 [Hordeum vulgare]|nr:hypothetical protein D1007_00006 [Hordeum vulgare]